MKIAFLNIYRNNNRGAESFTEDLAKFLSAKNEVAWFGPDKNTWIVQPVEKTNLLKRFFLDPASLSVLVFTLKLLPKLIKENPDVVIPMNGFWQLLLVKLLGKKTIVTGHSGPFWDERWNLYLKPDVFVATTEPTAAWAKKTCPWAKVVTIPYGIDIEKFKTAKPVKLNLTRPIILCPAAAVPYKRVHLAKQAVSHLHKGTLLHIGQGANFTVPHVQMPKYYAACDAVTLPSSSQENSPMVFLEAMAAGKTTVTTDTPRTRWILGDAGIFVDPENIEDYSQALEKRIDKKIIAEQAKKYSWVKIIKEYEELLVSLNR